MLDIEKLLHISCNDLTMGKPGAHKNIVPYSQAHGQEKITVKIKTLQRAFTVKQKKSRLIIKLLLKEGEKSSTHNKCQKTQRQASLKIYTFCISVRRDGI